MNRYLAEWYMHYEGSALYGRLYVRATDPRQAERLALEYAEAKYPAYSDFSCTVLLATDQAGETICTSPAGGQRPAGEREMSKPWRLMGSALVNGLRCLVFEDKEGRYWAQCPKWDQGGNWIATGTAYLQVHRLAEFEPPVVCY